MAGFKFRAPTVASTKAIIDEGIYDPREFTAAQEWTPEQKRSWEQGFNSHARFVIRGDKQQQDEAAAREKALEGRAKEIRGGIPVLTEASSGLKQAATSLAATGLRAIGQSELAETGERVIGEESEALARGSRLHPIARDLVTGVSRSLFTMAPLAVVFRGFLATLTCEISSGRV